MLPTSGKWYFEDTITTVNTATSQDAGFGIVDATTTLSNISAQTFSNGVIYRNRGDSDSRIVVNGSSVVSGSGYSWSSGDIVQIAYDADSGKVWVGRNNSWFDTSGGTTGNPSSGTNQIGTLTTTINMLPVARAYSNTLVMNWNFGQRPFSYTPPTGFVALNTFNLPTPTIGATASTTANKYMDATLYTGNGSTQTIANSAGFYPDFTWIKARNNASQHVLVNSVAGGDRQLNSSNTNAEQNNTALTSGISSSGIALGNNSSGTGSTNQSAYTYVTWQWNANNGSSSSNTAGSITSTVSANTSAGFSIVTFTAPSSNQSFTVGHGLGVAPSMVIKKRRDSSVGGSWWTWHIGLGDNTTDYLALNTTDAESSLSNMWGTVGRTSTLLGFNVTASCVASETAVVYCFAQVAGYSAMGSYTGNGSSDGVFVFTGFRPKYVLIKRTDSADHWTVQDAVREPSNVSGLRLYPNQSVAEDGSPSSTAYIDILSNGFKIRTSDSQKNANGGTYIYYAVAENPFKYAVAR
jgi:hypothetical protein